MGRRQWDQPADFGRAVIDDLRKTKIKGDYLRELRDVYLFYLDDERRAKLAGMGRIRRAFTLLGWILMSLLMRLSGPRRLLLLIALVLTILGPTSIQVADQFDISTDFRPWGFVILLFVLMLELKDKLLARDEIEIARQVQLALLPREHPELPGWAVWSFSRPANDVGGDLVDYLELDGFRHGVMLGDVAGKGLGAALLSAKLQATLRALVPNAVSLEDLGQQVNAIFYRDGLANRYATMFYSEIEYHSGSMRWLNAGHNPAFVIRADRLEKLCASSLPVGMMEKSTYEEGVLELQIGDVMLAYSDGLTEATSLDGEEFGLKRVEELLPSLRDLRPEEIGKRVLAAVDRFLGDAKTTDDLSLIVVRREDRGRS